MASREKAGTNRDVERRERLRTRGGGVTDHGALTGLAGDDHTQYIPVNASRQPTSPLGSTSAPTIPEHYIRGTELTASQSAQDAVFLAVLAGYVPYSAVSAFIQTMLNDVDAATARATLGLGALATLATVGTAQIDGDAVTFAKLQNVDTDKLIGRSTAGTGDAEQITCTAEGRQILAITGASRGDVLWHNGTSWVRLAAGAVGAVFTIDGDGNPAWVGP